MIRKIVPVLVFAALLTGCSDGDGTSAPPPVATPGTLLEGEWQSGCLPGDGVMIGSRDYVLTVTEQVFSLFENAYGDNDCGSSVLQVLATEGSYAEGLIEDGRLPEEGIPIDMSIGQLRLEPLLVPVAQRFNEEGLCGASDWEPDVDRDVSDCAAIVGDSPAPRTDYNRYFVDDRGTVAVRADDILRFGTLEPRTEASRRPDALDAALTFTRRTEAP